MPRNGSHPHAAPVSSINAVAVSGSVASRLVRNCLDAAPTAISLIESSPASSADGRGLHVHQRCTRRTPSRRRIFSAASATSCRGHQTQRLDCRRKREPLAGLRIDHHRRHVAIVPARIASIAEPRPSQPRAPYRACPSAPLPQSSRARAPIPCPRRRQSHRHRPDASPFTRHPSRRRRHALPASHQRLQLARQRSDDTRSSWLAARIHARRTTRSQPAARCRPAAP